MRSSVRARVELARRPWLFWALVGAACLATAASALSLVAQVERRRDAWGETVPVLVATRPVRPGDPIVAATTWRDLPVAVVPEAAVRDADVAAGSVARQRLGSGEIVTVDDVAAAAGPRALVPTGWLAVPLAEPVPSGAVVGDEVVVAAGGAVLSDEALVVHTAEGTVLVAVPADRAASVAAARDQSGGVALLLAP